MVHRAPEVTRHACSLQTDTRIALLPTARIRVRDAAGYWREFVAMLDSGSTANIITKRCAAAISATLYKQEIELKGLSAKRTNVQFTADLEYKAMFESETFTAKCAIIDVINERHPYKTINPRDVQIPNDLRLANRRYYSPSNIDILLGVDTYARLILPEKIELGDGLPILINSKLGWIVAGDVETSDGAHGGLISLHCAIHNPEESDALINKTLERFWEVESVPEIKPLTEEELYVEKYFAETTTRNESGRYIVNIPLDESKLNNFSYTKQLALHCFYSLEKRLLANEEIYQRFKKFISEYLEMGHCEYVEESELKRIVSGHSDNLNEFLTISRNYIPTLFVLKASSSSTSLRVVFNSSAKCKGLSYNELQYNGRIPQPDLVSNLLNMRNCRYILTADVVKMFRQILVNPDFRNLQLIFWRDSPESKLSILKLNTVCYGTRSAAYLSSRVLKQIADDEGAEFPKAVKAIKNNVYIDDFIIGADTEEELIQTYQELVALLKRGQFELHKFATNSPKLGEIIPEDKKEDKVHLLSDDKDSCKTLGLIYFPDATDSLRVSVPNSILEPTITKRQMLSAIAKIYDPLTLVAPTTIKAKLLMQKLWKLSCKWDNPIPQDLQEEWKAYAIDLMRLKDLKLPRNLYLPKVILKKYLCGFSDASLKAYAAAIYLVTQYEDNTMSSNLIMAKTKVAPVKIVSLPRLELLGAVLLAKCIRVIQKQYNISDDDTYLWVDSQVALAWISSEPDIRTTFVANRVSKIQTATKISQWHYVKGKLNPGDLATRGISAVELINATLWWYGPQFLTETPDKWPLTNKTLQTELETKKGANLCNLAVYDPLGLARFSTFKRLRAVIAYINRFKAIALEKKKFPTELTADELEKAELTIVRLVQQEELAEVMNKIETNKIIKDSTFRALSPFLNDGVLRVGGRLSNNTSIPYNVKHPIILPGKSRITRLILEYYHQKLLHAGTQTSLSTVRMKYWPIGGRRIMKKIIHECYDCFRFNRHNYNELMGNLPHYITTECLPFTHVGVDLCGPFMLKSGPTRKSTQTKAYISLFICMTSRSIHCEVTTDLTTNSFINALKRFIGRRSSPAHMYSDNGKNLVGCARKLQKEFDFIIDDNKKHEIYRFSAEHGIRWHFIPAYTPYFGGAWESSIGLIKYHLKRIVKEQIFTFEQFYTIVVQIEQIVNSRPLIVLNDDPRDINYLTPSCLTTGKPMTAPPEIHNLSTNVNYLNSYQKIARARQQFWNDWTRDYIPTLQARKKWHTANNPFSIGTIVLIKGMNTAPLDWPIGRIIEAYPGKDGRARVFLVKTAKGENKVDVTRLIPVPTDADHPEDKPLLE